jgi:putative serine protease PepD
VALIAGIIGATTASGIGIMTGAFSVQQTTVLRSVVAATPITVAADSGAALGWNAIDNAVAPSVVSIAVMSAGVSTVGSGLVLFEKNARNNVGVACVVTDRSLFAQAEATADLGTINVTFKSGTSVRGRLIDQDVLSGIALIEVPEAGLILPPVGSVADLHDADPVMELGASTVYTGTVSGLGQTVSVSEGSDMDNVIIVSTPATSASPVAGGPLLDQFGQVVGITVSLDPDSATNSNSTFAVPIDEAQRIAFQMVDGQPLTHPWLGVANPGDVPPAVAAQLGVSGGVQAQQVLPGGPASQLGISDGDIITAFDGQQIDSTGSLTAAINACPPGRWTSISFVKVDGQQVTASIEIANEPNDGLSSGVASVGSG